MRGNRGTARLAGLLAALATTSLQACTGYAPKAETEKLVASSSERDCLIRAMYFESNRSSRDGLMAVGTVVMNRMASPVYPNTICGVVGQPGQFAAGVLTRPLNAKELPPVERAADAILAGERYKPIGDAMHFHVPGSIFHTGCNMSRWRAATPSISRRTGAAAISPPYAIDPQRIMSC